MILAYAGDRLLRVYVDHPDINRGEKLWKLLDRIEELDCSYGTHQISPFLSSLGPAPNLKVFKLHDEDQDFEDDDGPWQQPWQQDLSKVFQGCLPLLRELHFAVSVTWPAGLFKDLRSLELGFDANGLLDPTLVLDVLRQSPLLENLRLIGHCNHLVELPEVALSSLKNCTVIGVGALSLLSYIDIPASTNVFLCTQLLTGDMIGPFYDLSSTPCFHVLDQISTVSFYIGFDTIEFQAENGSGGSLNFQAYYCQSLTIGLCMCFSSFKGFFSGPHSKPQAPKTFSLQIKQGASPNDEELVLCAILFLRSVSDTASLERMKLCRVPAKALFFYIEFLHIGLGSIPFPNLQQIQIETAPLRSPKLLLERLDVLLRKRKDEGVPPRLVDMKVNCEKLIPMAHHSAFLTAWKDLVGEDVRVEYFRGSVSMSEDEEDGDDDDDDDGEASGADSGSCDSDWESWASGKWPKAASVMRELTGT